MPLRLAAGHRGGVIGADAGAYGPGVYSEPGDLDRSALADALRTHWGVEAVRLDHMPVGFGSHHWKAVEGGSSEWFVSCDDLDARNGEQAADHVCADLDRAFRTAVALREEAGLEFVLAPVRSATGDVLHRLDRRYTIRVEPFVDGWAGTDGEFDRPEERRSAATLVGRLHGATATVPAGLPGREDFALPGRAALERALGRLDAPWEEGPFAEAARALLRDHERSVRERLGAYDRLAGRLGQEPGAWVVTHGEPHSANLIREPDGGLRLVDWDTVVVAPRERDLWMVLDRDLTGWDEYRAVAGGRVELDHAALRLYRERWALGEICEYVARFGRPHEETEDTRAAWGELGAYLPDP